MSISMTFIRHFRSITNPISSSYYPLRQTLSHPINNQITQTAISGINLLIHRNFHSTTLATEEQRDIKIINDSHKICKLLSNLPKNGNFDSVLGNCGIEVSPLLVLEALNKLNNSGVLALGFFNWAEKQKGFQYNTDCYNALIDSLGKSKQFKMIWILVKSMKSKGLLTKCTIYLIIRRYARAKKVNYAVRTFDRMKQFGMESDLSDFNLFLDTLCKSGQVENAQKVFDKMKKTRFTPDKKSYTVMLEGWSQQNNLPKLDEVFREMIDEGFEPDVVAFGSIINAYCKARKASKAVEIFKEMEVAGIKPSPHIYCILINGLGLEKRLDEARKFFDMSRANGVMPEIPTYNAVVGSYCWSMRFDEAFRMVDEMRRHGVGPNARTYNIILYHLIKAGKNEEAYSTFRKMGNDEGCDPTQSTYEMILRMFSKSGRFIMAIQVWGQMVDKGVSPGIHSFAIMINGFRRGNELELATKYFVKMVDSGIQPPASLFNSLKQALLDQGKKDTVIALATKFYGKEQFRCK